MFRNFSFDQLSFWIGFGAGALIIWLSRWWRPLLKTTRESLSDQLDSVKRGLSTSIEERYRKDVLPMVQGNHIASPLFSLAEIAFEPRLMLPPAPVIPQGPIPIEDIAEMVIPYMPDWPELSAAYNMDTVSIPDALKRGLNLVVMGKPGSGKTFALSLLTLQVAKRDPKLGEMRNLVPVLVHVSELALPVRPDGLIQALYAALSQKVSTLVESQLSSFLETIFTQGKGLLIVDGLDELPNPAQGPIVDFLEMFQERFPKTRMVVAASTEDISCIERLSLYPLAMASWRPERKRRFIHRWGELWEEHVLGEPWARSLPDKIDPLILNHWLMLNNQGLNPLELTLKVWSAYAGDALGPTSVDAIESYIRRMTANTSKARPALEQLAVQMTLSLNPIIALNAAGRFVAEFEDGDGAYSGPIDDPLAGMEEIDMDFDDLEAESKPSPFTPEEEAKPAEPVEPEKIGKPVKAPASPNPFVDDEFEALLDDLDDLDESAFEKPKETALAVEGRSERRETTSRQVRGGSVRRMLPELVETEIMTYRPNSMVSFSHPTLAGYLAGSGLSTRGGANQLISQPAWSGKLMAWEYLAAHSDVSNLIPELVERDQSDLLKNGIRTISTWPRYAANNAPWKSNVMRSLVGFLQQDTIAMGIRARVLAAIAFSGESGMAALFRQLVQHQSPYVRVLGALGVGIIRDLKSIGLLADLLYDPNMIVYRAASLALVRIDTDQSLEAVAGALLQGQEEVRRAAAEALAGHPREGYEILREGSTMEDLLVRRAVVYGLARVNEPWAIDILKTMQVEDEQWVVRNACTQTLDDLANALDRIPQPLGELAEKPWLVTFASDKGMGIAPGQMSWDMLAMVLKEGNEDQILAAMDIYRVSPIEARKIIPAIHDLSNSLENELRDAAFNALWHLNAAGVELNSYLGM